jgi:hypothetical protein
VRGDDQKHTGERERYARNDRPRAAPTEHWDLRGDEPDTGEEDEQESDFGEANARVMCESQHWVHALHFDCLLAYGSIEHAIYLLDDLLVSWGDEVDPQTYPAYEMFRLFFMNDTG